MESSRLVKASFVKLAISGAGRNAMIGAAAGGGLGALGGYFLGNKKNRVRRALLSALGGAGVGGLVGSMTVGGPRETPYGDDNREPLDSVIQGADQAISRARRASGESPEFPFLRGDLAGRSIFLRNSSKALQAMDMDARSAARPMLGYGSRPGPNLDSTLGNKWYTEDGPGSIYDRTAFFQAIVDELMQMGATDNELRAVSELANRGELSKDVFDASVSGLKNFINARSGADR